MKAVVLIFGVIAAICAVGILRLGLAIDGAFFREPLPWTGISIALIGLILLAYLLAKELQENGQR